MSTKTPINELVLNYIDKLIIGRSIVFAFIKVHGISVGNSWVETNFVELAPPNMRARAAEESMTITGNGHHGNLQLHAV